MFELRKIYFFSALKVAAIIAVSIGLAAAVVYYVILLSDYHSYYDEGELIGAPFGIFATVSLIIVALTAVLVPIYNLIAEHFGGIEIYLMRADTEQ